MSNKPIDLGALQDALRNAEAKVRQAGALNVAAHNKLAAAQGQADKANEKLKEMREIRDAAKRAVLEGARQVANG